MLAEQAVGLGRSFKVEERGVQLFEALVELQLVDPRLTFVGGLRIVSPEKAHGRAQELGPLRAEDARKGA
jgi:hypothetical protein